MESFFTLLPWPCDEQDKGSQREFPRVGIGGSERGQGQVQGCEGQRLGREQEHPRFESWTAPAAAPWASWCRHDNHPIRTEEVGEVLRLS